MVHLAAVRRQTNLGFDMKRRWVALSCVAAGLLACSVEPPRSYNIPVYIREESVQQTPPPLVLPNPLPHIAPVVIDSSPSEQPFCSCDVVNHSAPLVYGAIVTLTTAEHTIRLQTGDTPTIVQLPLAASVIGQRWTVKMWGDDANEALFLPATDPETGLMDAMNDIDGDSFLSTSGLNPAIVIEAYVDKGDDGPLPGWMVLSR